MRKQNKDSVDRKLKVANKIVSDSKARLNQIEKHIIGIYEDKNNGILSLEIFTNLIKNYENERAQLKVKLKENEDFIIEENERLQDTTQIIKTINKYTEIKELTPEILTTFIKKIIVHEKEIIDGKKARRVDVYFNGLGEIKF